MKIQEILEDIEFDDDNAPLPKSPDEIEHWEGDQYSKILLKVKHLLDTGNGVDWLVPGAIGHVIGVMKDGVRLKPRGKPYSKKTYFMSLIDQSRDDKYKIIQKGPIQYAVVSAEDW